MVTVSVIGPPRPRRVPARAGHFRRLVRARAVHPRRRGGRRHGEPYVREGRGAAPRAASQNACIYMR